MIMNFATKAGFTGGLVVDYPNSKKAKKFYLCLMTGPSSSTSTGGKAQELPAAYGTDEFGGAGGGDSGQVQYERGRNKKDKAGARRKGKKDASSKDWILRKKSLYRQRGKEGVPNDSKYVPFFFFLSFFSSYSSDSRLVAFNPFHCRLIYHFILSLTDSRAGNEKLSSKSTQKTVHLRCKNLV